MTMPQITATEEVLRGAMARIEEVLQGAIPLTTDKLILKSVENSLIDLITNTTNAGALKCLTDALFQIRVCDHSLDGDNFYGDNNEKYRT